MERLDALQGVSGDLIGLLANGSNPLFFRGIQNLVRNETVIRHRLPVNNAGVPVNNFVINSQRLLATVSICRRA
jgi:hypothetical protein